MITIKNLNVYTNKGRNLIKDFSFVLNSGDKIGLIGEEGNGKSTLLKIMSGIDVQDYVEYTGKISCEEKIGYLPQNIEEKYFDYDITDFITDKTIIDYVKFYDIIKLLNIDNKLLEGKRLISTLSGGERVKVSLGRVLYSDPDILLFDEPTNDLDIQTLIWLEEFIKRETRPIIFISHDETLLENCSNGILHLEQYKRKSEPKITFSGEGYKDYSERRIHNILRNNEIARKEKQEFHKQLEKYRQVFERVQFEQNSVSRQDPHAAALLKKKMHAVKSFGKKLDERKENLTQLIEPEEAIDIFFEKTNLNPNKIILDYKQNELRINDNVLCRDIELLVQGKDKICIIGNNGCGKSTLLKEIYQKLKNRDDIKLGYMPQNYYEVMDYNLTPVEYLLKNKEMKFRSKIQNYLGAIKFTTEEMSHKISELSEGQKCKILVIKMILDNCNVLLLDEPTRNLSPLSNPKIREILSKYDGCIISVSHDRKYIDEVVDTVYQIEDYHLQKID